MRSRKAKRWNRKAGLFVFLLILSVFVLFLPPRYTDKVINLAQVLMPFQAVANDTVDSIATSFGEEESKGAVPREEHEALERELQRLRNLSDSLIAKNEQLEKQNRALTGIRELGLDAYGQLIPARVISDDLLSWRHARVFDAGTMAGSKRGAAVVSNHFNVDVGEREGAGDGLRVLAGEALVGMVAQAGTHVSRVKLLTDPSTRMVVTIGRRRDGGLEPMGKEFWLVGVGEAGLEVRDVDHQYVKREEIQAGDVVMTVGDEVLLPMPVPIGTIREIRQDPDNGLLYILQVEPLVDLETLRRVYIVATDRD